MFYISDIIRKLMIDRHINVTDLSRKMGISTPNLSRKFQNKSEDYKISYLHNVLQHLDCDIRIQIIDSKTNDILYIISDTND